MDQRPVSFSAAEPGSRPRNSELWWGAEEAVRAAAVRCEGNPEAMLRTLESSGEEPPVPAAGQTQRLWELLASVAATDLVAARTLEPHLDAAGILSQAGMSWPAGTAWGVFAAQPPNATLAAVRQSGGGWELNGTKPWCSLAAQLTHALVTAPTPDGGRLFMVSLRHPGVEPVPDAWVSRGMAQLPSGSVNFTGVPAQPVQDAGWYLSRPGFAVGGVGVAACWFGAAVGIYRHLLRSAQARTPDQLALAWLGEADRLLAGCAALLEQAAGLADAGALDAISAHRVRGQVAGACERVLQLSGHATGPGPLTADEEHARRAADLGIYLRQHHAARDDAALGQLIADRAGMEGGSAW